MTVAGACVALAACSATTRTATAPTPTVETVALSQEGVAAGAEGQVAAIADPSKPVVVSAKTAPSRSVAKPAGGGLASWYGDRFHGRPTANGERFNMGAFTAAHRSFPLPSYVRVTNVSNGRSIVVRVNDRGPFHGNRVIDVSRRTADVLGFKGLGVGNVKLDYIGKAPEDGSDDRKLLASYQEFGRPSLPEGVQMASLASVSDNELAAEAGSSGGVYAMASNAVSSSASAVASTAKAAANTATAAVKSMLPSGSSAPKTPAPVAVAANAPSGGYGVSAYAPPQPLVGVPAEVAEPKRARTRVIAPQAEPVLASATPELRTSYAPAPVAQPASSGSDVSSRIASSFDSFGSFGGTSVQMGGSVSADVSR